MTAPPEEAPDIKRVYAGDRISDLLNHVDEHTLLVTHLSHGLLSQPIELMDIPALCVLNGATPPSELVEAATQHRTTVLVSPYGMYETCGRLYQLLHGAPRGDAST